MSLVELLVAMVLVSILGAIVSVAVMMSNKQVRIADDEATGLSDTRVVVERLGRDIRGSRGVDAGATKSNLVLWIDYNSDYIRSSTAQANEIITWAVVDNGSGVQYNTLRSTAGGQVQTQARTLVNQLAFCYLASADINAQCLPVPLSAANAAATKLVKVTLTYNALLNTGTASRTTTFTERIRNVG